MWVALRCCGDFGGLEFILLLWVWWVLVGCVCSACGALCAWVVGCFRLALVGVLFGWFWLGSWVLLF